jgi:hypothetical protein
MLWFGSGAVGIVYASLYGIEVFTGSFPVIRGLLGPVMNVLVFAALLGLYPIVADRRPWLARAGGVCAVLAMVGATVGFLTAVGVVSQEVFWVGLSQVLFIVVGMSLAFLTFGVASLRSAIYSRIVGLLLLVPGIIVVLMIAHIAAGYASPETAFVISAGEAMAHLAIGTTLLTEAESSNREETESVAGATAKG